MSPSLNLSSARAQNARYAKQFGSTVSKVVVISSTILLLSSLLLILTHKRVGFSLIGVAILGLMAALWKAWKLDNLVSDKAASSGTLDGVLEPKLLAELKGEPTASMVWQAAINTWEGVFVAQRLLLPVDIITSVVSRVEQPTTIWLKANELMTKFDTRELDGGLIVAAVMLLPENTPLIAELKISVADIEACLGWALDTKQALAALKDKPHFGGIARDWASGYTPTLNRVAHNLSADIEKGYYRHLPPVHQTIVDQMATQLSSTRPRVALVGDVGVGKTSLVYDLAERLLKGQDSSLKYYKIIALDASVLVTSGQHLEELMLDILGEASRAKNIILFLDEAQLFFASGTGSVNLSNLLLNILQQSNIKVIFAFHSNSWQSFSAANPSLAGMMQKVVVSEPAKAESIRVLQDAAIGIEHSTDTVITYSAITEAYKMAGRYMTESSFPGKGITILEQAAHLPVAAKLVTALSVQQAVEHTIGVKVAAAGPKEQKQLLNLESEIHKRMVNQVRAVKVVSDALRRARAGVSSPNRPVGGFLFLGPTGVGKTELAKSLAAVYFGGEANMIRLDMTEYQQASDISRILAPSPGGAIGSSLVSAMRQKPFSVVLLDEIEKAHPDVLNLLLQILDEGSLTDGQDRKVSFKDAIVIATSNAGATEIVKHIEAGEEPVAFEKQIVDSLLRGGPFRPELMNRFDAIVMFQPLGKPELEQIAGLMIAEVNLNLKHQGISVILDKQATAYLVEKGYDPRLGARPMRRAVQNAVENVVAKRILSGSVSPGTTLALTAKDLADEPAE